MLVFGNSVYKETSLAIYIEKEGRYIYFRKPYNDENKEYRMDLGSGVFERINHYKTTGTKISEVKVPNITKWFSGCSLFCEDEKFARVILFNKYHRNYRRYSSPVRFVQTLTDRNARIYEAWLSLGIDITDVKDDIIRCTTRNSSWWYRNEISCVLSYAPNDFSKDGLNYIKKNFTELSRDAISELYRLDKQGHSLKLFDELLEKTSTYKYRDFFVVTVRHYDGRPNEYFNIFDLSHNAGYDSVGKAKRVIQAICEYNLDVDAFLDYCMRLYHIEGLELEDLFDYKNHYNDYLDIERKLKRHKMPKMDKYPTYFLSTFHMAKKEYRVMKQQFNEELFKDQCDRFRHLEETFKKYSIVVPERTSDIEHEADELKHCVRSYIPRVVDGKTLICFLRSNEDLDKPLITIEVKDNVVTQAYGLHDGKPSDEQIAVMRKWAKKHKLTLQWAWG